MSYTDIQLAAHAKNLREELGIDQLTPIGNIENLVKEMGHDLKTRSFGDDFSATCMSDDGIKFTIILNEDQMWNERFKRFTIAHELGHISLIEHHAEMHRQSGRLLTKAEFQSDSIIEREADKFAVHFLAPKPFFNSYIKSMEFDRNSLIRVCKKLGISFLTCAFRFIELTDLCCSLVVVDNSTQKIKYEFRSKLMKEHNRHESISGWYIPPQGLVSRALLKHHTYTFEDEEVDLSEYYHYYKKGLLCKESVFKMSYNNTTVVMLSALDDVEELL